MCCPGEPSQVSDEPVVVDASAIIDLVVGWALGEALERRLAGAGLHAPAHLDAEVLSGLGRIHRAGEMSAADVTRHLDTLAVAPITRHDLPGLLAGAWARRQRIRLADALYVELAEQLGAPLVTTDRALARTTSVAEAVTP